MKAILVLMILVVSTSAYGQKFLYEILPMGTPGPVVTGPRPSVPFLAALVIALRTRFYPSLRSS